MLYLCANFVPVMRTRLLPIMLFCCISASAIEIPRDSIPEDHLAWFAFRGPVREVREYDYADYGKTIWRFDEQGRLTEYYEYTEPFIENGGCVFALWAHYQYAYDKNGKIELLEIYNADYNTVDDFADLTLQLFPHQSIDTIVTVDMAEREFGDTSYCWSVWKNDTTTQRYHGRRFDNYGNWIEDVDTDLDDHSRAKVRVREFTYYPEPRDPRLTSLDELPKGCNEKTCFWLDFSFKGYVFEGSLYPLHNNKWLILSYWALDEDDTIYLIDENGGDPILAASKYKDPFKGIQYPVIETDSVGFATRNYNGETIKLYANAKGKRVLYTLDTDCPVDVLDADPKTRRIYCRTNPSDWVWEQKPFKSVIGWMDEEWVCSNLLTTCP